VTDSAPERHSGPAKAPEAAAGHSTGNVGDQQGHSLESLSSHLREALEVNSSYESPGHGRVPHGVLLVNYPSRRNLPPKSLFIRPLGGKRPFAKCNLRIAYRPRNLARKIAAIFKIHPDRRSERYFEELRL
jgi:hypothetical protein